VFDRKLLILGIAVVYPFDSPLLKPGSQPFTYVAPAGGNSELNWPIRKVPSPISCLHSLFRSKYRSWWTRRRKRWIL